jgi:hypothetical protein
MDAQSLGYLAIRTLAGGAQLLDDTLVKIVEIAAGHLFQILSLDVSGMVGWIFVCLS